MSKKEIIATYTTYNVICENGHIVAKEYDIGEYPWSWQYMRCGKCGHAAVPDEDNPVVTHVYKKK